jgi:hypothetical protein
MRGYRLQVYRNFVKFSVCTSLLRARGRESRLLNSGLFAKKWQLLETIAGKSHLNGYGDREPPGATILGAGSAEINLSQATGLLELAVFQQGVQS